MPRPPRALEEGRLYHVYNRVGGGAMPFADEGLASRFVQLLGRVIKRDELVVYAWSLMSNHYHLVVRMGAVPLSMSMKTLHQEVTRSRNREAGVFGPLWQGRFKAKWVEDERYLGQLIAYVHLNPVAAGLVSTARDYRWSGHREVLGLRRASIVAVDNVLTVYGSRRSDALRAYRSALGEVRRSEWSHEPPGHLPWWRLGRPPEQGEEIVPDGTEQVDMLGRPTSPYRRRFDAEAWIDAACSRMHVSREALASRSRSLELVRAREVLALVGVARYGVKVRDLAASLGKSEDGVSLWMRRGSQRRLEDAGFAAEVEALDAAFQEAR